MRVSLALVVFAAFSAAKASPAKGSNANHTYYATLAEIQEVLSPVVTAAGKKSVRIYYAAVCEPDHNPSWGLPFPDFHLQAPSKGKTGLAAVQDVFRDAKDVAVSDDRPDLFVIRLGKPADAILSTRIQSLVWSGDARHFDSRAIWAVLQTQEVQEAMRRLGLQGKVVEQFVEPGTTEDVASPLPESLSDVTMDEALDVAARALGTMVLYGACTIQPWFGLDIVQVVLDDFPDP